MCKILANSLPLTIFEEEEKNYEQQISFEGDGDRRDGNGAKYLAYILQFWYYNHVAKLSLWLLAHAYHVDFQLVKNIISVCDCVIPHVERKTSL